MQALGSANNKRIGVAEFRREIRSLGPVEGAKLLAQAIEHDHDDYIIGSGRIGHLMRAVPRLGERKVTKCLLTAGVYNQERKLRELTARQRGAVVIQLEMWADAWS
jgi:hypothetical protein